MSIKIDGNFVCIGGFCFCETPTGLEFDGEAQSSVFCSLLSPVSGQSCGFTFGGRTPSPGSVTDRCIDKFPFATDTNATGVGQFTQKSGGEGTTAGQSSSVSGYISGGGVPCSDIIEKYPFVAGAPSSDVGELSCARTYAAGVTGSTSGYTIGGCGPVNDIIDKFPFSADAPATDVAEYGGTIMRSAGHSSSSTGYGSGGCYGPGKTGTIRKFPFAADSSTSVVGSIGGRADLAGQSSPDFGYASGGLGGGSVQTNTVDKFPFASDTNSSDVGDLTQIRSCVAGQSSTVSGYTSGGTLPGPLGGGATNTIDKFPFASDTNASDVGNLTQARNTAGGHQV